MSDETEKNPNAFPMSYPQCHLAEQQGMSLRDYFAAAALQGLLASPAFWGEKFQGNIQQAAFCAYDCADSMLKAREAAAQ